MTPEDTCFICLYWDQRGISYNQKRLDLDRDGTTRGVCRRYPPLLDSVSRGHGLDLVTESPVAFVWPMTWSDDVCGEIRRK